MEKGAMKGGFLRMVFSVLGVVLIMATFSTIMVALISIAGNSFASTAIAFTTVIGIAPTLLLLGAVGVAGFQYKKGYSQVSANDANGLIRIVFGVLEIILFVTLFGTIMTSFGSVYTSYGGNTSWIAFGTVLTILPTVLFLGGLFAGGATVYGGIRARGGRR